MQDMWYWLNDLSHLIIKYFIYRTMLFIYKKAFFEITTKVWSHFHTYNHTKSLPESHPKWQNRTFTLSPNHTHNHTHHTHNHTLNRTFFEITPRITVLKNNLNKTFKRIFFNLKKNPCIILNSLIYCVQYINFWVEGRG